MTAQLAAQAPLADPAGIRDYHAHVYYIDAATRAVAAELRDELAKRFACTLGRWHDKPVGPHPVSMFQVAFPVAEFPRLVPWLTLNHRGLSILIHPETGDDPVDHTEHALWLGAKLPLDIDKLR
jgi:aromatic ring-cleaving dioxygenase